MWIKEKRSKIIAEITQKSRDEFLESFVGKTLEVLFEQPHGKNFYEGKTGNYITVCVPFDESLSGEFKNVKIEKNENGILYGTIQ